MLQPFKFITVVMKERTNEGMELYSPGTSSMQPIIKLKDDLRYHPITMNDENYGVPFVEGNKTRAVIGVLMESFNKTFAQHKVLVHGIVPMRARANVKAGMKVYWSVDQDEIDSTEGIGPYVGIALKSALKDDDMIDVLVG